MYSILDIYTYINAYVYIYIYVRIFIYMYLLVYIYMYSLYVHIYAPMYPYVYISIYTHIYHVIRTGLHCRFCRFGIGSIYRFTSLMNIKTWSARNPCPACSVTQEHFHDYSNISMGVLPATWGRFTSRDWKREVDERLRKVVLRDALAYADFFV